MSKHIITKSKMIVVGYVDAAVTGRRLFILPGEVFLFIQTKKKSAEVIVVVSNEPCPGRNMEVSQNSEGLNIKLFQMLHGVRYSHALSGTGKQKSNKMIEQVINRRNMHLAYKQVFA